MKPFPAVLTFVSVLAVSSAAGAGGYGHGHHHGHYHGGGDAALVVGALVGGLVLGHVLTEASTPRRTVYVSAPRAYGPPPGLSGCQPTTGTGYANGRTARFGGTMCFDRAGNGYILNNSTYLLGYLD